MIAAPSARAAHLHALLDAYQPADSTEARHVQRLRGLLVAGEQAFARDHWVPGHVTASAFVLDPGRDSLLLIHHQKLDIWVQPGGHVDPGDDDVLEACRREVREEVGLAALSLAHVGLFDVDVHPIPARSDAPAHEHFDVRFLFVAADGELTPSDEVKAARWVELEGLDRYTRDASVRRAAGKIRS